MLLKLAAARTEAGYNTKKMFVSALNNSGLVISNNTYNRIEAGRQLADVDTAIFIAEKLNRDIKEIFFDSETQKMSRNVDQQAATLPMTGTDGYAGRRSSVGDRRTDARRNLAGRRDGDKVL